SERIGSARRRPGCCTTPSLRGADEEVVPARLLVVVLDARDVEVDALGGILPDIRAGRVTDDAHYPQDRLHLRASARSEEDAPKHHPATKAGRQRDVEDNPTSVRLEREQA